MLHRLNSSVAFLGFSFLRQGLHVIVCMADWELSSDSQAPSESESHGWSLSSDADVEPPQQPQQPQGIGQVKRPRGRPKKQVVQQAGVVAQLAWEPVWASLSRPIGSEFLVNCSGILTKQASARRRRNATDLPSKVHMQFCCYPNVGMSRRL